MELAPFGLDVLLVQPGAVESNFGSGAKTQTGKHSWKLYERFTDGIERRAGASQQRAMPTAAFAKALVHAVLASRPTPVV